MELFEAVWIPRPIPNDYARNVGVDSSDLVLTIECYQDNLVGPCGGRLVNPPAERVIFEADCVTSVCGNGISLTQCRTA